MTITPKNSRPIKENGNYSDHIPDSRPRTTNHICFKYASSTEWTPTILEQFEYQPRIRRNRTYYSLTCHMKCSIVSYQYLAVYGPKIFSQPDGKSNSYSYSETRNNPNEPKPLSTDSIIKHYVQINGENYKLQTLMVSWKQTTDFYVPTWLPAVPFHIQPSNKSGK